MLTGAKIALNWWLFFLSKLSCALLSCWRHEPFLALPCLFPCGAMGNCYAMEEMALLNIRCSEGHLYWSVREISEAGWALQFSQKAASLISCVLHSSPLSFSVICWALYRVWGLSMGKVTSKERWAHLIGPLREELSGAMASSPTQLSHPGFWAVGFMALHKPVIHPQLAVDCGLEGLSEACVSTSDLGWFPLCFTVSALIMCVCPSCPKGFSKRRFDRMQLWSCFSITLDWYTNLLSFLSFMCSISHPRVVLKCASTICTRWNVSGYFPLVENGIWVIGEGVWIAPKISVLLLGWFCLVDLFLLPLLLAAAHS